MAELQKTHSALGSQSATIHFGRVDLNVIDPGHLSDPLLWPLIRLYVGVGIKEKGKKMESNLKPIVSKHDDHYRQWSKIYRN